MKFGGFMYFQNRGVDTTRVYDEHLAEIELMEALGFDEVWLDYHLLSDEGDWHDPKLEGWSALAAVAAVTSRVRVGLLVAANTFRNPGLTAKLATTLDHISDGRATLGLGAGWFAREHEAFGLEYGETAGARLDRLVESVPLIRRYGPIVTSASTVWVGGAVLLLICLPSLLRQNWKEVDATSWFGLLYSSILAIGSFVAATPDPRRWPVNLLIAC